MVTSTIAHDNEAALSLLSAEAICPSCIRIEWICHDPAIQGFCVERCEKGGEWKCVQNLPATATFFESVGLFGGQEYEHRIRIIRDSQEGKWLYTDTVSTPEPAKEPQGRIIVDHQETGDIRNGTGTFLELSNGALVYYYSAFDGGTHDWDHCRIKGLISHDDGNTWEPLGVIFEAPERSIAQPGLVRMANGDIGLTYHTGTGFDKPARRVFHYSSDEGQTWSEEIAITDGTYPYMTGGNDRLLRLSNDRILCQTHAIISYEKGRLLGTDIYYSDDHGRTWHKNANPILQVSAGDVSAGEGGINEATFAEYEPGKLILFGRTNLGWLSVSYSTDYGTTWSQPVNSHKPHPQSMPRILPVPTTKALLLLFNSHVNMQEKAKGERRVLGMQLSDDLGATWHHYKEIEYCADPGMWHDYPVPYWKGAVVHVAYRSGRKDRDNPRNPWIYTDVRYRQFSLEEFMV